MSVNPPTCHRGAIIQAVAPGKRGEGKVRPLVVISDAARGEEDKDATLVAVAISSTTLASPSSTLVDLPWHPEGMVSTRLRRTSVAVCDWVVELPPDSVIAVRGRVPDETLRMIIEKVRAIQERGER